MSGFVGAGCHLPTAGAFMVLSMGILFLRCDDGFMRVALADNAAGLLVRRLLPSVIIVPIIMGWLQLRGQNAGLYGAALGDAMRVAVMVLALLVLLWWTAALKAARER